MIDTYIDSSHPLLGRMSQVLDALIGKLLVLPEGPFDSLQLGKHRGIRYFNLPIKARRSALNLKKLVLS
jgi:hypothetical protein